MNVMFTMCLVCAEHRQNDKTDMVPTIQGTPGLLSRLLQKAYQCSAAVRAVCCRSSQRQGRLDGVGIRGILQKK